MVQLEQLKVKYDSAMADLRHKESLLETLQNKNAQLEVELESAEQESRELADRLRTDFERIPNAPYCPKGLLCNVWTL